MLKPTRFKQILMHIGLLAIGEEVAVLSADMSAMTDEERSGAIVNSVDGAPSAKHLQQFLESHHLKIAPEAFASPDSAIEAPLATPAMKQGAPKSII